jgi:hypothetical protein
MTPTVLAGPRRFCRGEPPTRMVASAKRATSVSVCLPARYEATTKGDIIATFRTALGDEVHRIDELVVVDDRSSASTAGVVPDVGDTDAPAAMAADRRSGRAGPWRLRWERATSRGQPSSSASSSPHRSWHTCTPCWLASPNHLAGEVALPRGGRRHVLHPIAGSTSPC